MILDLLETGAGPNPSVVDYFFEVAPARVYRAWTDPNIVMKWFGHAPNSLHSATIDLRTGGAWRFLESQDDLKSVGFEGEYLEIGEGKRLVFTWVRVIAHADGKREESLHAKVEVSFTPKDNGTSVRVVHTATRPDSSRRGIGDGWRAALASLDAVLR